MSYVFDVGDEGIWSPALRVGELFVATADSLATIVGVDTGLHAVASDYYDITAEKFFAFVLAVLRSPYLKHPVFQELSRGFLATALVLLDRAAAPVPDDEIRLAGLLETKGFLSSSMATV
jgi:Family of unknown function (DUF6086)